MGEEILVGNHARQAVGAKQEPVARTDGNFDEIDRDVGRAAERARHDVLERVALRLVLAEDAGVDLLLDPGMVVGQAPQLSVPEQIGAAVADVDERRAIGVEEGRHDRRAHAFQLGPVLDGTHDLLVRFLDRRRQSVPFDGHPAVEAEGPRALVLLLGGGDIFLN